MSRSSDDNTTLVTVTCRVCMYYVKLRTRASRSQLHRLQLLIVQHFHDTITQKMDQLYDRIFLSKRRHLFTFVHHSNQPRTTRSRINLCVQRETRKPRANSLIMALMLVSFRLVVTFGIAQIGSSSTFSMSPYLNILYTS